MHTNTAPLLLPIAEVDSIDELLDYTYVLVGVEDSLMTVFPDGSYSRWIPPVASGSPIAPARRSAVKLALAGVALSAVPLVHFVRDALDVTLGLS